MQSFRICTMAIVLVACALPSFCQFNGSQAARAADELGNKARTSGNFAEAAKDYKQAISLDPNFVTAYQDYFSARHAAAWKAVKSKSKLSTAEKEKRGRAIADRVTNSLIKSFQIFAREHPEMAVYPWALGQIYDESDPLREEVYCRRAVHIDPSFAPGYQCLADVASLRGDQERVISLRRKVMELEPKSAEAAFLYSWELQSQPDAYREATIQLVQKFPHAPRAAQALYWYADHQKTDATAAKYFEQLYKQFPPKQFDWSEDGTEELFGIYDRTDPSQARKLAHEMLSTDPTDKDWAALASYADAMAKAEQEINENNPAGALSTVKAIKSPAYDFDMRRQQLLFARALDLAGKQSEAYQSLLTDYAKHPTAKIHAALAEYGAKVGKNSQEIGTAVWSAMKGNSKPAIPFTLEDLADGEPVSLESYRGRVVIVDFWFPNCGPCRQSFPYLQRIASKYRRNGLAVLAINGIKGQEPFAVQFLKSEGYEFIPLKGSEIWDENVYHVHAYPSTFLIGEDGRLYFRPHIYNRLEESATELEVNELLAHGRS